MKWSMICLLLAGVTLTACGANTSIKDSEHTMLETSHEEHAHHEHQEKESLIHPDAIEALWSVVGSEQAQAGRETTLRLELLNHGEPIEQFDTNHEQKQHLMIVSKDLSHFAHVHPVYLGKGIFEVKTEFPSGGAYKLIADFVPTGGNAMSKMEWIEVEGEAKKPVKVAPDDDLLTIVDGKQVTLQISSLAANEEAMLTYILQDARTSMPVTNLEPYMGAIGHVVVLSEDTEKYLHVHPLEEEGTGPDARFVTEFPGSGIYKIWGQFKHNDKIITIPFVVKVP